MSAAPTTTTTPGWPAGEERINEVRSFMEKLEIEPAHVLHVTTLALQIFDELQVLHQLSRNDRFLLEAAARLHDIGWSVSPSGKAHHKESARLIREHSWKTILPDEIELIAQVARYHRRALPSPEHEEFEHLTKRDKRRVEQLAAILRVGDALDRSHLQKVQTITCAVKPQVIEFLVYAYREPGAEIAAAQKKGDLAEQVFGRALSFKAAPPPSAPKGKSS